MLDLEKIMQRYPIDVLSPVLLNTFFITLTTFYKVGVGRIYSRRGLKNTIR